MFRFARYFGAGAAALCTALAIPSSRADETAVPAPVPASAAVAASESNLVIVKADLRYGPLPEQTLDLCMQKPAETLRPGVVLIHGGGWTGGGKAPFAPLCRLLAESGFVTINVNYRLVKAGEPATQWPAQLADVQLAVRWLRANAPAYRLDPSRLCAYGDSAGGHLAVFLGVQRRIEPGELADRLADQSPAVACVVDNFGPVDLTEPDSEPLELAARALLGASPASDRAARVQASPLFRVSDDSAVMLVAQGDRDKLIPPSQSDKLVKALKLHRVRVRQINYHGGHEWIDLDPDRIAEYQGEEILFMLEQLGLN